MDKMLCISLNRLFCGTNFHIRQIRRKVRNYDLLTERSGAVFWLLFDGAKNNSPADSGNKCRNL